MTPTDILGNIKLYNADCMKVMKTFKDEQFVPIKGWEHYLISNNGLIFNTRTKRMRKAGLDHKGYLRVRLTNGRTNGATKKVHRLVAQAFLSDYSEDLQVNHKNCIKTDNRVENLEMVTQSQNTKHAWENGRMKLTKRNEYGVFCR